MKITKPNITPGPWLKSKNSAFVYALNQDDSNRFDLSINAGYIRQPRGAGENEPTPKNEVEANAKAIAVVPELIDFLIEVQKAFPSSEGYKLLEKAGCVVTPQ